MSSQWKFWYEINSTRHCLKHMPMPVTLHYKLTNQMCLPTPHVHWWQFNCCNFSKGRTLIPEYCCFGLCRHGSEMHMTEKRNDLPSRTRRSNTSLPTRPPPLPSTITKGNKRSRQNGLVYRTMEHLDQHSTLLSLPGLEKWLPPCACPTPQKAGLTLIWIIRSQFQNHTDLSTLARSIRLTYIAYLVDMAWVL